jgi:hypothetical protein
LGRTRLDLALHPLAVLDSSSFLLPIGRDALADRRDA